MEQELRFGLDLGWLALLKKNIWADYELLFFGHTIKLHKMKLKKILQAKKYFQLCLALLETPHHRTL